MLGAYRQRMIPMGLYEEKNPRDPKEFLVEAP